MPVLQRGGFQGRPGHQDERGRHPRLGSGEAHHLSSTRLPAAAKLAVCETGSSAEMSNAVVDELVKAHILRQEVGDRVWVEVADDRLIEPITRDNADWRKKMEELRQKNQSVLECQAAVWESKGRQDGILLREEALEEAEDWSNAHELTPT